MKYADDLSFLDTPWLSESRAELIKKTKMESTNDYFWEAMFWLDNAGQCFFVILIAPLLFIIVLNGKLKRIYHIWKRLELKTLNIWKYSSFRVNFSQGNVAAFKKVKESFLIFKVEFRFVAQSFII